MSEAAITWISGPVLRARAEGPFRVNEALEVGPERLLGEVIRLHGAEVVAQVYEDTTGLKPGMRITGTGAALSVPLGPNLLGCIFDGLLRPLATGAPFVRPGTSRARPESFYFKPSVKVGETLNAGTAFGTAQAGEAGEERAQHCLAPPTVTGEIVDVQPEGDYTDDQTLCAVEDRTGQRHELSMIHHWPVRRPRPIAQRLAPEQPMLTGQRVLDFLFPVARGGKAALPGGFGTGKTVLQQSLAKWCDADIIVYVGCGERGNEMAEVLHEFPRLEDPRTGRRLMERTVIIANTSNMPVAAREASIYTGITVAEYFRDQGLHVALMADSTSRWAEALREVSGRLGELPSEAGYPAYLSSRLAEFYERAAHVRTLGGRDGSVTVIGAISPPGGDFSEPVTTHTRRYVRAFWALDRERAHARFYPAIHPLQSYSEDCDQLAGWWRAKGHTNWNVDRRRLLTLLDQQSRLERMARIIGKEALPERQQLILLCADLINEGFLRQSAFSPVDRYCSPERQIAMLKVLVRFLDLAEQALEAEVPAERIGGLAVLRRLRRMNEEIGEDDLEAFEALRSDLESALAKLTEVTDDAG